MACAFCEDNDVKERTIFADELVFSFLTNMPIVPGHVLVAPVRHVARYEELTGEEMTALERMRIRVANALKAGMAAEGFNFAWNEGEGAGQSLPHMHLHVVPRTQGDAGVYGYEPRSFLYRPGSRESAPTEELRAVRALLQSTI